MSKHSFRLLPGLRAVIEYCLERHLGVSYRPNRSIALAGCDAAIELIDRTNSPFVRDEVPGTEDNGVRAQRIML